MFDKKCVVVTGAAGNLGTVVCARLAQAGASVFALARGAPLPGVVTHAADLTDEAAVEAAYAAAEERFGAVYASVQCAGGWEGGTVSATPLQVFEKMIAINLRATFLTCRAALTRMEPRHEGRIVNVAAYQPFIGVGIAGSAAYAAAKAGIISLTRSIAEEGARTGIRASCVAPGTMRTPQNASGMPNADQSKWIPLEDVAEAIVFLASPSAGAASGSVVTFPAK